MLLMLRVIVFILFIFSITASADGIQECGDLQNYCQVSIVNLLIQADSYDGKNIVVKGYLHKAPEGPFEGYWISLFKDNLDIFSSIKLDIPDSAPQRRWIETNSFYGYVGTFVNCETMNCRPRIKEIKIDPRIVTPLLKTE